MKTLKKIFCLLLVAAIFFTMVACTVKPQDVPSDEPNNEENGENNGGGEKETLYAQLSEKIVTDAITKLETAKSVKFSGVVKNEISNGTESYENNSFVTVTVSETDGKLSLSVEAVGNQFMGDTELTVVSETVFNGGYVYTRSYYYPVNTEDGEIGAVKENALWNRNDDALGITQLSFDDLITAV